MPSDTPAILKNDRRSIWSFICSPFCIFLLPSAVCGPLLATTQRLLPASSCGDFELLSQAILLRALKYSRSDAFPDRRIKLGVTADLLLGLALGLIDSALEIANPLTQSTTNVSEFTRS